jgi:hypothetical protein
MAAKLGQHRAKTKPQIAGGIWIPAGGRRAAKRDQANSAENIYCQYVAVFLRNPRKRTSWVRRQAGFACQKTQKKQMRRNK